MWELISELPAQKILTTNSGELLAAVPLRYIRRIVTDRSRHEGLSHRRHPLLGGRPASHCLSRPDQAGRRVLRPVLGASSKERPRPGCCRSSRSCAGTTFPAEGIRFVEFAQSGLTRAASAGQRPWHRVAPADRRRRGRARLRGVREGAPVWPDARTSGSRCSRTGTSSTACSTTVTRASTGRWPGRRRQPRRGGARGSVRANDRARHSRSLEARPRACGARSREPARVARRAAAAEEAHRDGRAARPRVAYPAGG